MSNQYKVDSLRFKFQFGKKQWNTHPDMEMAKLSNGHLRFLDTKLGKETLLIIPDGPNIIEHYFEMLKDLRKKYRVVIFDLYGFGFSTHNGTYDYSFKKTNELLLELLDFINIDRVNIVFPCAIGFYGLYFTSHFPEKVNQLVLLQTPSHEEMAKWTDRIVPDYLKRPYVGQMIMPWVEKKFATTWYDYALPKGVDRLPYQKIATEGIQNGGNFCLCSLTQGLVSQLNQSIDIDTSIPTTLLYGDKDFTHKSTNFESIRVYHKNIDIIRFENCGHFPDLERSKDFMQIIGEKINP